MLSASLRSSTRRLGARSLATSHGAKTQYTTLENGITVATETNSAAKSATLGLYYGAGSTSENPWNNGVSNLLNNIVVGENVAEAAKSGLLFSAHTDRDYSAYVTQGTKGSLSKALELLNAKAVHSELSDETVFKYRSKIAQQIEAFEEKNHSGMVLEHLHNTAFQNTPLALPIRGTSETVSDLVAYDVNKFAKSNFVSSNTVVVASGDVAHEEVVELVEKKLKVPSGEAPAIAKPAFLGSEVRMRDDTLPGAWIAFAQEGEALNSDEYFVAKVAAEIFGSFNYHEPIAKNLGVKLNNVVNETHLADTYSHFSLSYKDTGLWGVQAYMTNINQIDDFVHFALKEWNRLTISISETEVARGKQLFKNKVLFNLNSPLAIANDIGSKVLGQGRRPSVDEIFTKVDQIDVAAVKAWADRKLWDQEIAVSGTGQIESLLDYNRIRNDTSMMRW
ncbi:CYFA0S01e19768g1_1 [Cyberlindnera fabianii]|uniref:CYFA0S01e19768g1_1 n=1 Tax=Cyberlindnera fabianii TaxID=36022 RepID=A0A061AK97_CYBFA|nr:Cytochrome b-c1 complex subunit 1, mitochondrial [Cyberlindnera fabianii]CDR37974.1 CYFA0S01e19768g1_1 [Cyberlindnera fabianii]